MKPVGKPDAFIGHVRFDERGWETGRRSASVLAPILDSTEVDSGAFHNRAVIEINATFRSQPEAEGLGSNLGVARDLN